MDEMSSNTVKLLVKNIPLNVDDKSLLEVFEEHGQVVELEMKTYGWFEQKHASVYYATKVQAENAFEKLNGSSIGGNEIKANFTQVGVEHSNGEVDSLETLSHNRNAFVDQVNSEGNPLVKDNDKVQDNSKANLKVPDNSKENAKDQNYSKENTKVQNDSKENSKANPMPYHNSKCKGRRNVLVSGLSQNVSKSILKAEFEKHAKVESITILKQRIQETDCNHGYVILDSDESAERVIHELNQTPICGKIITVNWANDKSDLCCVFISGLPLSVSEDGLRKHLVQYGRLLPHKIKLLKSAENNELHTYVHYVCQESAKKAVQAINWSEIFGNPITVILNCHIKDSRKLEKELFVENLLLATDKVSIKEIFQRYGEVTFVKIFRGYFEIKVSVMFSSRDSAEKAFAALNGANVFGKNICVSWASHTQRQGLHKKSTKSQELEQGNKMSVKFQAKADYVKAPAGRGKGSSASTKSLKTNTVVGKSKRHAEAANVVSFKAGEDSTPIKTNSLGRGRGQCRKPPLLLTPGSTHENLLANQSINHRFSSIVHKYSVLVLRPLSKEVVSGIKYVLEVSLKSEMEKLVTCIKKVTKLKASVDGDDMVNRSKNAVESLGTQLLQTLGAVDWTKLASFYNKSVTCPRAGTKMTEAEILVMLRRGDKRISEAEGSVNQLINHLRSIVRAIEDVQESDGGKPVLDMELEERLEKAQECLDHSVENRDEEMIVWGKNKVEEILDEIDTAWDIVQEDSDVIKLMKTMENPRCLFERKASVKNKNISKLKSADLNVQHFQSKNQLNGGIDDSNIYPREKKPQTKRSQKSTVKFKSTETGYMQVQEIKTLIETHTRQPISPQMKDLLSKLDRDRDGWIFYDEFEAALTPDLLNVLAKE